MTLAIILVAGVGVSGAFAWYLDFNVHSQDNTGSIYYAGGDNPLVGVGIQVDDVVVKEGNGSSLTLNGAVLNFTTGNLISYTQAGSSSNGYETWIFGAGGSISITDPSFTSPLMSGTWNSAMVLTLNSFGEISLKLAAGSYDDQKNGAMLNLLQLEGYDNVDALVGSFVGGLNLSFVASSGVDNSFSSSSITSGDVPNTPVPVPAALWLLGSGLIGLIGIRRRSR